MRHLTLVLTLCAGPALACPTADDLPGGIIVSESDGVTTTFTTGGPNRIDLFVDFGDGYGARNTLLHGSIVARLADTENGMMQLETVYTTRFDISESAIVRPATGVNQVFETTVTSVDGPYAETVHQRWGRAKVLQIGACSYTSIPGKVSYTADGYTNLEILEYLPDLGFALLVGYRSDEEPIEYYEPIRIEAVN